MAANTSDDMVRGWKKIDDANQQQQYDIIPGKSNNSLASAESHPTVTTDANIINEALSCSGVSEYSPIVLNNKKDGLCLTSLDIKKKEGSKLPKLPTMKGKSAPSDTTKPSPSQQPIQSCPESEQASYIVAANIFGIKEFTCMKDRYSGKADDAHQSSPPPFPLSSLKDDRRPQVPKKEQLLQSSDEIRHDSSFSFADDDNKAPRTKPSLGFLKRRHVHHPSGGVRQGIKSVERARAA